MDEEETIETDESTDDEVEELEDDAILDLGDGEEEDEPDNDEEEEPESDEDEPEEEEEEEPESDEKDEEIAELKRQIKNLNKGAYQMRKALEAKTDSKGEDEVEFTDAQLLGMLQEHKDDPAVQMQIMKYIGQQSAKNAKAETLDATQIASTKKEVDAFVSKNWPEINEEGSDLRKDVDEAIKQMRLEDHPFAEYLGISAALLANLPDMIKMAEERGKKTGIKDKTETNRKQSIKDKKLSSKGKKKGSEIKITNQAAQTGKQLGLSKDQMKIYSKLLNAGKKPVTAEV